MAAEQTAADGDQHPQSFGIGQLFWFIREAVVVAESGTDRIRLWNPAAEELFGYTAAEALQLTVDALVPEGLKARHRAGIERYTATGHGHYIDARTALELPAIRKGGQECTVELTLSPIDHALSPGRFVLAILRDVTERKRAEAEHVDRLQAEAALRAHEELVTTLAHDLRNPLASVLGRAQLLRRWAGRLPLPDVEQFQENLAAIEAATSRMTAMLCELQDVTQLRRGQPLQLDRAPVALVDLVRRVIGDLQQTTLDHTLSLETTVPEIVGAWDAVRLARVLENLLSNAVKYSPNGGPITVAVIQDADPSGSYTQVTVRDVGVGIPSADLPHIFQRFHRGTNVVGRIPGTGIGLAGARQITELHGGSLTVSSEEGRGTTVTLRLPMT